MTQKTKVNVALMQAALKARWTDQFLLFKSSKDNDWFDKTMRSGMKVSAHN